MKYLYKLLTAATLLLSLSLMAKANIKMPLSGWKNYGVKTQTTNGKLEINYSKNFKNTWPEARLNFNQNLNLYNCISLKIKVSRPIQEGSIILYCTGARSILTLPKLCGMREIPADKWLNIKWFYKKNPGWITGPKSNSFNYEKAKAIGIGYGKSHLQKTGNLTIELKDIKISNDFSVLRKERKEFAKFRKKYRSKGIKGKKTVLWLCASRQISGGMADLKFLAEKDKLETIKKLPVNGVIVEVLRFPFRDQVVSAHKYPKTKFDEAIKLFKNIDMGHLTDNFLRIDIVSHRKDKNGKKIALDWFDDSLWQEAFFKLKETARVCKEINFKGIVFDNESYRDDPYDYFNKYRKTGKSFEEYEKQARKRGQQFAEAIAAGFPKAKIIFLFGNWYISLPKNQDRYGLWPAFLDGMLKSQNELTFYDGFEKSYDYRIPKDFVKGYFINKNKGKKQSSFPKTYAQKLNVAFACWLRPKKFSPAQFVNYVRGGLMHTDKYVWLYAERNVFTDKEMQKYLKELKKIKN